MNHLRFIAIALLILAGSAYAQKTVTVEYFKVDTVSTSAYSAGFCVAGLDSFYVGISPVAFPQLAGVSLGVVIVQNIFMQDSLLQNPGTIFSFSATRFSCSADHAANILGKTKTPIKSVAIDTWSNPFGNCGIGTANQANVAIYVPSFPCWIYYCMTTTGTPHWTGPTQVSHGFDCLVE
jgi:hypothetical protein